MKKCLLFFTSAISFMLTMAVPASAQDVNNFFFTDFNGNYFLSRTADGSSQLKVDETLVASFPNYPQNHGILRAIPETYQDHTLGLKVESVDDGKGTAYRYTTYSQNDNLVLKIGDPGTYVEGAQTYHIVYTYRDVINFAGDNDQFFWDTNGDQWPQPFNKVSATLHIPASLAKEVTANPICYVGSFGSKAGSCTISELSVDGEKQISFSTQDVRPYQTLSIAVGFNPGGFKLSPQAIHDKRIKKLSITGALALAGGLPLAIGAILFRQWRRYGDDPKGRGVIIPQYEPPAGLSVIDSSFIYLQKLSQQAITASIIDWAIKGYITIYEIPKKGLFGHKDYELEVKKTPEGLSREEQELFLIILDSKKPGERLSISEFKKKAAETNRSLKKLESQLGESLTSQGYFQRNPKKLWTNYGAAFFFLMIPAVFFFGPVLMGWRNYLVDGLFVGLVLTSIVLLVFAVIMPAKTQKGVDTSDWLKGLEDYIAMAEADRLKYLQSPAGAEKITDKSAFNPETPAAKVKLFEKLLPYAILFGLEKDWAKQFQDIYTVAPDWYQGNWTSFNAGYLAGSIGDFNGVSATSFSSPSSGGGGAGGGGGGGGGGGW